MFNGSRGRAVAGPAGLVDVVDRSPRKKAQQIWVLVGVITGLAAMVIASESMHPILAGAFGVVAGVVLGGVCALWVYVWPFVRFVWWWIFEISALVLVTAGWMQLVEHTTLPVRAAVVTVVVGVPGAIGPIRRRLWAVVLCFAMRHRIRKCFHDYIIVGRFDPEPFILMAKPTKAGESVWVLLRSGVSIDDVHAVPPKMIVTCWAKDVTVTHASTTNKAYVRFDITRRHTLAASVASPLTTGITGEVPVSDRSSGEIPTNNLDYHEVKPEDVTPTDPPETRRKRRKDTGEGHPGKPGNNGAKGPGGDDVSDWI